MSAEEEVLADVEKAKSKKGAKSKNLKSLQNQKPNPKAGNRRKPPQKEKSV